MSFPIGGQRRRAARLTFATAAALAPLATLVPTARAATWTWTGAGTGNQLWSNTANWTPDPANPASPNPALPVSAADTTLIFGTASGNYSAAPDIVAGTAGFNLNLLQLTATSNTPTLTIGGPSSGRLNFVSNGAVGPRIEQNGARAFFLQPNLNLASATTLTLAGSGSGLVTIQGQFIGGTNATVEVASTGAVEYVLGSSAVSASTAAVTLTSGSLVLASDNQPSGLLSLNGGRIGTSSAGSRTVNNAVSVGGNVTLGRTNAFALNFMSPATLAGTAATRQVSLNASAANVVAASFQNAIGDAGNANGLTVAGTGVLVLGNADVNANTYTGATTVNSANATLRLNKAAGTDAVRGNLTLAGGSVAWQAANQVNDAATLAVSGGTLAVDFDETVAAFNVSGGAFTVATGATLTTTGASLGGAPSAASYAVPGTLAVGAGGLTLNQPFRTDGAQVFLLSLTNAANDSGTLRLSGDVTLNATSGSNATTQFRRGVSNGAIDVNGGVRTFTVADTGANDDLAISANLVDSGATGGLIKAGAGTLLLTNSNSAAFNRPVTVSAGQLLASGSSLGGPVTINSGGALGGNASSIGPVALTTGGTLNAGLAAGGTGTLTLASLGLTGGTVRVDVASAAAYDVLVSNGSASLGEGLATLDLAAAGAYAPTAADRLWLLRVADAAGPTSGYFAGLGNGASLSINGQAAWIYYDANFTADALTGGNDVVISFTAAPTAVPEPTAVAVGLIVSGMAMLGRRRAVR